MPHTSNSHPSLTNDEQDLVAFITCVSASLGLFGSLFIIVTYVVFQSSRSFGTKIVVCLSVADVMHSVSWFPWAISDTLCIIQAAIIQFSQLSAYLWTLCIAWSIFMAHYKENDIEEIEKKLPWYYAICWGFPFLVSLIPIYEDKYGRVLQEEMNWCWISDASDLRRALTFVPCVLIFFINCVLFVMIHHKVRTYSLPLAASLKGNMILYLLAFLFAQAVPTGNMLQNLIQPEKPIFFLYLLQGIFNPLQGLFDGVAYGVNEPAFTSNYKLLCIKCGISQRAAYEPINSIKPEDYNYDVYASNGSILYERRK